MDGGLFRGSAVMSPATHLLSVSLHLKLKFTAVFFCVFCDSMDRKRPFQKDPEKLTIYPIPIVQWRLRSLESTGMKSCLRLHFICHKETLVLASIV